MTISPTLDQRFREAAAAAGLLDVAYDFADTPVGTLLIATTERGLCRISYDSRPDRAAEALAETYGPRVLRAAKPLDPVRRQLDEYFEGTRTEFELPIDLRQTGSFSRAVLTRLARVPYGEVTTYGALAAAEHRPKATRAVGTVMNRNPIPIVIPCHRVVGANGSLVGYAGGLVRKEQLLTLEGAIQPHLDM
jgi:methylated-DNA-[protein]-cysteine S-methyltransferase